MTRGDNQVVLLDYLNQAQTNLAYYVLFAVDVPEMDLAPEARRLMNEVKELRDKLIEVWMPKETK